MSFFHTTTKHTREVCIFPCNFAPQHWRTAIQQHTVAKNLLGPSRYHKVREISIYKHTHTDTYTRHTHTVGARSSSSSRLCWSPTSFHVIINDSEPSAHFDPHTHAHLQLALIMDFLMELRQKNERTPPFFSLAWSLCTRASTFRFSVHGENVCDILCCFSLSIHLYKHTHTHTHMSRTQSAGSKFLCDRW